VCGTGPARWAAPISCDRGASLWSVDQWRLSGPDAGHPLQIARLHGEVSMTRKISGRISAVRRFTIESEQAGCAKSLDRTAGLGSRERASLGAKLGAAGANNLREIRTNMNSGQRRIRGHGLIRTGTDAHTGIYGSEGREHAGGIVGALPRTHRRSIHASRNLSRAPAASLRDRLRRPWTEPV
jgi:hypothetical protein